MATAFATVEQLVASMQRDIPIDTARLAIERATGAIRAACQWTVNRDVVVDEVIPVTGSVYQRGIWLPTMHLVSVEAVVENGVTLDPAVGYAWSQSGLVTRGGYWYWPLTSAGTVVVSYTHGYEATHPVMDSVRGICLAAATRSVGNPAGRTSETTGSESWSVGGGTSGAVGATLTDSELAELAPLMLDSWVAA